MTDPLPEPGPPLVIRVEDEPPFVVMVEPVTRVKLPRPGLFEACLLTVGFAVALFGTIIGMVLVAFGVLAVFGDADALKDADGGKAGSVGSLPPLIAEVLAWSFPVGYAAGLLYAVVVFRIVVGRGWAREVGLRRFPAAHLALALIALPGFTIVSDAVARLIYHAFGMEHDLENTGELGEMFRSFHWSFVVLAIGVGPGLVEEVWCRGFLGRGLIGRYGWLPGIAMCSLFFGLLHLWPPPFVVTTALMGIALHFTYVMSRSLWVPVTIHLLNNSFAGLAAVGAISTATMDRAMAERPAVVIALAIGLLAATGLAMWSARAKVEPAASVPHRGVMVPLPETDSVVIDRWPHPLIAIAAVGFAVGLIGVLFG